MIDGYGDGMSRRGNKILLDAFNAMPLDHHKLLATSLWAARRLNLSITTEHAIQSGGR